MDLIANLFYCAIVSVLWGATNPLIKNSTREITSVESTNLLSKFFFEIKYLIQNWKYVLFFLLNQLGSVLYFLLLQNVELSLAVPITNALTFIVTGVVGILLGEEKPDLRVAAGVFLVLSGVTLCLLDKVSY